MCIFVTSNNIATGVHFPNFSLLKISIYFVVILSLYQTKRKAITLTQ